MQRFIANKPIKLVTDKNAAHLAADEASFLKGYRISFNKNQLEAGKEGGNLGVGTGYNSNRLAVPSLLLPAGVNKNIGYKEYVDLNQGYYMNWNSNGLHGIYRINGDDLSSEIVMIDKRLNFSRDPKHAIPGHRISVKAIYNSDDASARVVKEIELKFVDGLNWQFWINVQSAIATKGYDATAFPYYKLRYPHYDFEELIQWAVRPPMFCPLVTEVPADGLSLGKANQLENKSVQFATVFNYTDGRSSTLSPYSTPYTYQKAGCTINAASSVRCLDLQLNVGGPSVESILLLQRNCSGEWKLYDTIQKYKDSGVNAKEIIGNKYWLRTNPWVGYTYTEASNSIKYRYCGDKECALYSASDAIRFETDLPIVSTALAEPGDANLLMNNLYGYDNLSADILSKIKLSVVQDQAASSCPVKTVKIMLSALLMRESSVVVNQFLWRHGAESLDIRFGGAQKQNADAYLDQREAEIFGLNTNGRTGIICYLAGTSYYAVSKQVLYRNGVRMEIGVLDLDNEEHVNIYEDVVGNRNGVFTQEWEFNVPAGNYIARVAAHDVDVNDPYEKTSTYVGGIFNTENTSSVKLSNIDRSKEIFIAACDGDVNYNTTGQSGSFYLFVPWATDYNGSYQAYGRFITGYVTERSTDTVPVEGIYYDRTHGGAPYIQQGGSTDHNGFFWSLSGGGDAQNSQVGFFPRLNCASPNTSGSPTFVTNITGSAAGYYPKQNKTLEGSVGGAYGACNRVLIRGTIKDCDNKNGLGGLSITLTGTQTYYTNAEGEFEIIAHPLTTGVRTGKIVFNGNGTCSIAACDCTCIPVEAYDDSTSPCVSCNERIYPVRFDKKFKVQGKIKPSMKQGGRYAVSIRVSENAGRGTFANRIGYVDIPAIVDSGKILPASIAWAITGPLNLPKNFKYLSFLITKNLNNKRYLQWVGDKIEFLDVDGDATGSGNGAILAKISIQSLLDYNVSNNFSVNTIYQFVAGDKIRFIDNGQGDYFAPDENGYLEFVIRGTNFDTITNSTTDETEDGKSILIDYDSRLLELKDKCGFWIELISPRACEDLESYCEVCGVYPIIDGNIQATAGTLNAYDTYFVNRKIIIPGCSTGTISHPFESSAISDYYGADCDSCGRLLVIDDKAEQLWVEDDVIKSDEFVNEGRVNGLGTFRAENRKKFKGSEWGGIVAAKAERGLVLFVCQNDFFIANYQYNFVRANTSGILQADLDTNLSEPNQKVGDNFGCDYEDTMTIDFFDGMGMWADAKNSGVILTDFRSATDISKIDNKSWFINKFKYVNEYNRSLSAANYLDNMIEKVAGIDAESNQFFITFRPRKGLKGNLLDFISNEHDFFDDTAETMVYNIDQKAWVSPVGFAPESYGRLRKSISGMEFITFAAGRPYLHNSKGVKNVNQFYGIKTDTVIEPGFGKEEEAKEKLLQSLTIESRGVGFFIGRLSTNTPNLYSYVPSPFVYKKANVYDMSLLRNMNIYQDPNKLVDSTLLDGAPLTGLWTKIQLVKDIKNRDIYTEINYIWLRYITVEKSKK